MSDTNRITCEVQGTTLVSREPTPFSLGGMMDVWQDLVDECTRSESDDDDDGVLRPATITEQAPDEITIDMAKLMRLLYNDSGAVVKMNKAIWETEDGEQIIDEQALHINAVKTARVIQHFIVAHTMLLSSLTDTPRST